MLRKSCVLIWPFTYAGQRFFHALANGAGALEYGCGYVNDTEFARLTSATASGSIVFCSVGVG
jgi:hypothetical protein